jgi:hypothetical protein
MIDSAQFILRLERCVKLGDASILGREEFLDLDQLSSRLCQGGHHLGESCLEFSLLERVPTVDTSFPISNAVFTLVIAAVMLAMSVMPSLGICPRVCPKR